MKEVIEAEFQVMEERTPETIRAEIKTIEAQVYKTTLDGVIQIGKRLRELKEMMDHGKWLPWCEENLGYSKRQAQKYMELSEEYGKENSAYLNTQTCAHLSISKAYSLLALSEEEVGSFSETHDMESMTVKELEAEIKDWKRKHEALEKEKEGLRVEMETAKEEQETLRSQIESGEARRLEMEKEMGELKESKADPEEIEALRKKLEKEKGKAQKLKEELKQREENQKEAIDEALTEQKERIQKEAEEAQARKLRESEELRRAAESQAERLKKKLERSGNEKVLAFKLKADQMQEDFKALEAAVQDMEGEDPEQAGKLKNALKTIMETLIGRLGA